MEQRELLVSSFARTSDILLPFELMKLINDFLTPILDSKILITSQQKFMFDQMVSDVLNIKNYQFNLLYRRTGLKNYILTLLCCFMFDLYFEIKKNRK